MPLHHGLAISAEEVERIIGREFPLPRFASMCNSLIWASAKPKGMTQVAFTERVLVADKGVDGEWSLEVPEDTAISPGLVIPGRNVFQYKQRDPTSRDRLHIISELRTGLRNAAAEVATRTRAKLQKYALFTNVHLTAAESATLQQAIAEGYDSELAVQILGAAEIASLLNSIPHLRSGFFATSQFATWEHAWRGHSRAGVASPPHLVGRESLVKALQSAVDDDAVDAILISGISDIGKSRLAFAATEHRQLDTIFALDPVAIRISDLIALQSSAQSVVVVIDDPDISRVDDLVTSALAEGLKILLTVPNARIAELIDYGRNPKVKLVNIGPLSDTDSEKLLQVSEAKLDYSVRSWVVEQAGGIPGILLTAASIGTDLRIQGPLFRDQVGGLFEAKVRALTGELAAQSLQLLSIMTAVGITGDAEVELERVHSVFGGPTPNQTLNAAGSLAKAGFLRIRGNYLEVVPPMLANYLAQSAVAGRSRELAKLFRFLTDSARPRLLRRIRQLRASSVDSFWNEMFGSGSLATFESALVDGALLRLVSSAVPDRVANLLLPALEKTSLENRLAISGNSRRELVWTLDQLLFRRTTSGASLRGLALLAEAENETWGNNATGVFCECFHPLHPQLPLPLEDRLAVLQQLLAVPDPIENQLLVTKAVKEAFYSHGVVTLRRSEGAEPFDPPPMRTYSEIYNYLHKLIELVRPLVDSTDPRVATAAADALISGIREFTANYQPEQGIQLLEEISSAVLNEEVLVPIHEYVGALQFVSRALEAHGERFGEVKLRVNKLLEVVNESSFSMQVKRWVGSWEHGEQEIDDDGQPTFHGDLQVWRLGQEAAAKPDIVGGELLGWLTSSAGKRSPQFFFSVGKHDECGSWRPRIEEIATDDKATGVFAAYFGGVAVRNPDFVEERLDQLCAEGRVSPNAIVGASGYVPGNARGVARMRKLLAEGRVQASEVERRLMAGGWMRTLSSEEAVSLLEAIAGPDLSNATLVIDFLAMWVHSGKEIKGDLAELAWRCLEMAPTDGEAWDYDVVAVALARESSDRAFGLIEKLLVIEGGRRAWEPLDRHGTNRLWNFLWTQNRERCLRLLFEVSMASPFAKWRVSWHLPEILNLEQDNSLLLAFGHQDEESATFLSSIISATQDGFWPIVISLLSAFPNSRELQRNVILAAEHMGQTVVGEWSDHQDRCAEDIENAIKKHGADANVRSFLTRLAEDFRKMAQEQRLKETDASVQRGW